jgi:selenocysteine lyase/cysteine desulfurase
MHSRNAAFSKAPFLFRESRRAFDRKAGRIVEMMRRIYLDNNATTPVLPEVLEAMRPYFGEHFGNASSIHHHGQETRAAVERARDSVASLLGCRPQKLCSPAAELKATIWRLQD